LAEIGDEILERRMVLWFESLIDSGLAAARPFVKASRGQTLREVDRSGRRAA